MFQCTFDGCPTFDKCSSVHLTDFLRLMDVKVFKCVLFLHFISLVIRYYRCMLSVLSLSLSLSLSVFIATIL